MRLGKEIHSRQVYLNILEDIFRKVEWENEEIKINNPRFADDVVLIRDSIITLQELTTEFIEATEKAGHEMSM